MIRSRSGITNILQTGLKRSFAVSVSRTLIYKSQPKIPKPAVEPEQASGPVADAKDEERMARLEQSRWYKWTPRILKPYARSMTMRPLGFGISFAILHEITAIVPFLGLWWFFLHYNWVPLDVPQDLLARGAEVLSKGLINLDVDLVEKTKIVTAGANAYAATKLLLPVRLPVCFALAPFFDRWCVRPIQMAWRRMRVRAKAKRTANKASAK
ncbi:hypothetical protein KL921_002253 [Ogataea angusta]|uniref:Uncharacterized protein n=1 Tax=Pichia angusta TaxID=870730 RepID=A0AAN6I6N0_PICAN|nr:uncharacterized protein KL928_002434 [Ogataea angusta]KAG7811987.1 hypothetical protein KL921_002253 [Ogataea angusta]KAG7819760.1 hypothetical protein KL928_002434 [Ogataea angusta]KAG7849069.1 hypothetical protein KL941_001887 [Ogataea angusta]